MDALGGLADDLEVADHGVLGASITHELVATTDGVGLDPLDALQDVDQVEAFVSHSGTASASTRSRMYQ